MSVTAVARRVQDFVTTYLVNPAMCLLTLLLSLVLWVSGLAVTVAFLALMVPLVALVALVAFLVFLFSPARRRPEFTPPTTSSDTDDNA